ncbi:MAG: BrnT family toxin [Sphingomonas sp.]|uniref:BrnT family toxin n=1 Tax=Sphingomonas sp. TaxID=28214 RepID=UPI0035A92297|nr:BrnT family toxin [Sphingomonas sp.]
MFDFDPAKSAANKAKHGIDFVEAQALWDDEQLTEIGVVDYGGEERRLFVGEAAGKRWTAVVTQRGDRFRIISVRRARSSEEMAYDRAGI